MPELPEAETLARGLRPLLPGERIARIGIAHADVLVDPPGRLRATLRGGRIDRVERRGKNIVLALDRGRMHLVVNLGMTGGLIPLGFDAPKGDPPRPPTHPAISFFFESGRALIFNDVRRFGRVEALDAEQWAERTASLGPEPLGDDFTAAHLLEGLRRSHSPLRSWLLDQKRIAGVGNIYASEACFRAGIHPARPACEVGREEARRLHRGLRRVLRKAIEHGGTTLRDYRDAEGRAGLFGTLLRVYGREGVPCLRCRTPIERIVLSNRSAFLCPSCQR